MELRLACCSVIGLVLVPTLQFLAERELVRPEALRPAGLHPQPPPPHAPG